MNTRLATTSDADAIFAFWQATIAADPTFLCSPNATYPPLDNLTYWLDTGSRNICIVEDTSILLTAVYNPSTAKIDWLRTLPTNVPTAFPLALRFITSQCNGVGAWGFVGIVTTAQTLESVAGMTEDAQGNLRWVGP